MTAEYRRARVPLPATAIRGRRGPVTWSAAAASALAFVTVLATAAAPLLMDFYGAIVVLPISLTTFSIVGLVIALRRPRHPIGWLFLVAGACFALWFALPAYAWSALGTEGGASLPAGHLALWFGRWTIYPAVAATLLAVLLFPAGRPLSRIWALTIVLVGAIYAIVALADAFGPDQIALQRPWFADERDRARQILSNPLRASGSIASALLALKGMFNFISGVPLLVVGLISVAFRSARATGVERLQLRWFAYAASFSLVLIIGGFVLPHSPAGNLIWAAGMAALGLIPIGAGIAILRHQLFDIDVLISRTLTYGLLSGCVIVSYLVAVAAAGAVLHRPGEPLVSVVLALIVAVVFNPLRVVVQRLVDRLVYGRRTDPYAIVAELGRRLGATLDAESVLPTVVRTVADSLRLPYVAIELRTDDGDWVVASHGRPHDPIARLQLVYQQEVVGHLLVAARPGEATLGEQDLGLLEALGRQAGVAAHGVRAVTSLRRAREGLVLAREEERRRLLRDLHDELGPRLASHTLLVDAARSALVRDPSRADLLLTELAAETRRSLEEVRRIARGLRPHALDELGLPAALRDAAERCASPRLAIEMDITDVGSTSIAVETAAYHVAREALANVVRHADAHWCGVRLHRTGDGSVALGVEDDGGGVPTDARPGVGFESMRERAAEVGGQCVIEDRPGGGTRVRALFPFVVPA